MEPMYMPRTVEEVFNDYMGRRAGLIKALTTDIHEFYRKCDPESDNLCLYADAQEHWKVSLPVEDVPPEIPEPSVGINFPRDKMATKGWLSLIAIHSDAWLVSVATFYSARLNQHDRKKLFNLICELPSVFHVVSESNPVKEKTSATNGGSKLKSSGNMGKSSKQALQPAIHEKALEENEDYVDTFCGSCGALYTDDEFWIGCDVCEKWFHGKCVKVTPARAEHIKKYKCPSCTANKRFRS